MAAGDYLSEAPNPLTPRAPPVTHCMNTYASALIHTGVAEPVRRLVMRRYFKTGIENTNMTHCISTFSVYKLY
jgi:hypothetical protein